MDISNQEPQPETANPQAPAQPVNPPAKPEQVPSGDTVMSARTFFNMPFDGPISRIRDYLNSLELDSFYLINKNIRFSPGYYKSKALRIPREMSKQDIMLLLPALLFVEKISITSFSMDHLSILKNECLELRHLVVDEKEPYQQVKSYVDQTIPQFMDLLSTFQNLRKLQISSRYYSKFPFPVKYIGQMTELTWLDLSGLEISAFTSLSALKNLVYLDLSKTSLEDLPFLSALKKLQHLDLTRTYVSDISTLAALTELKYLDISRTNVHNLSALSNLRNLSEFKMEGCHEPVSDISCFTKLTQLTNLDLAYTKITDPNGISSLAGLTNLKSLSLKRDYADETFWQPDLSSLQGLTLLEELDVSSTKCQDFSFAANMRLMKKLDLSFSKFTDIEACANMEHLNYLKMSCMGEVSLVPLRNLKYLTYFDLEGCWRNEGIEDLPANVVFYANGVRETWR